MALGARPRFVLSLLLAASASSGPASAADVSGLTALFARIFRTHYDVRACGSNIQRLVEEARAAKLDLAGAKVMKLESPDFWELQTFAARNYERGDRRFFYHHWVLVADGRVFDFDFTNEPRVVSFEDYMVEMFVPKGPLDIQYDYERSFREVFTLIEYDAETLLKNGYETKTAPKKTTALAEYLDVEALIRRAKCEPLLKRPKPLG